MRVSTIQDDAGKRRGIPQEFAVASTAAKDFRESGRIALELLELARVAAHTQERRFAPLASYLAGVAAERLRAAKPDLDDAAIADFVQEVRREIEDQPPPTER
jgi:hypothetical protein